MALKSKAFFLVVTSVLFAVFAWMFYGNATITDLPTNKNWGSKTTDPIARDDGHVKPFELDVDPEIIHDLRQVLNRSLNLQPPLDGAAFRYGFNSKSMKSLVNYWRDVYLPKWTTRQQFFNQLKQYHVEINGLSIHYIHEKPKGTPPTAQHIRVPILLLHGWPGSVREFYDLIPKLTSYSKDHVYTFEVVAPSLVGYGFSEATNKQGFCTYEMAIVMRNLMTHLGYDRFIVHGGDWGSIIGSQLTTLFPDNVVGYHSNFCLVRSVRSMIKFWLSSMAPGLFLKDEEYHHHFPLGEKLKQMIEESGYFHLQATKPDTIGIALATSPVGLAAYILEKFSTGTNSTFINLEDGGLSNHPIKMDALLDNIMVYYLSNSITSSMRFYAESTSAKQSSLPIDNVVSEVPMACIRFKNDIPSSLNWQLRDKFPNLVQSTYVNRGGHFAAMELPDVMYKDIIQFIQKLAERNMLLDKKAGNSKP